MGVWAKTTRDRLARENAVCRVLAALGQALGGDIAYRPEAAFTGPATRLALDVGGSRLAITLQRTVSEGMAASYYDLARNHVLPPELVGAAFETAAASLAKQLEEVLGAAFTVVAVEEVEAMPGDGLCFSGRGGPMDGVAFAVAVDPAAPALNSGLAPRHPAADWRVAYPLRVGSRFLAADAYDGLAPMDIVVLAPFVGGGLPAALMINAYTALSGTLTANKFTIEGLLKGQNAMAENKVEEAEAADAAAAGGDGDAAEPLMSDASIGALPVRLDFDIGQVELSFAELSALTPGHAFDLGAPAADAVTIRVSGRKVGVGELIEIDGRIGVRIRTLSK